MTPNEFERIGSGYLGIKQWCWKGMKLHCGGGGTMPLPAAVVCLLQEMSGFAVPCAM